MARRGLPTGVQRKHSRSCATRTDGEARCRCRGGYQVQAGPRGARQTRTFASLDAAVAWKRDMDRARAEGRLSTERAPALREAVQRWRQDAKAGVALARGGKPFGAGTLYDYDLWLEAEILPELGSLSLDRLTQTRLNEFAAALSRRGLAASTVRNVLMPVRAVFRHAERMGWTTSNPTRGMVVPSGSGRRRRVLATAEIDAYLRALPERDRALWATAVYAGLRRGELRALRWANVDLAAGVIRIDPDTGSLEPRTRTMGAPKSEAGGRRVAVNGALREVLVAHRARNASGLVFARGRLAGTCRLGKEAEPFDPTTVSERAVRAWNKASLSPIGLHDCRHTFASLMIAAMAGRRLFNPKLLQQVMGHSSIQVTYDRYGHLFPGQEVELGVMLDELLAERPAVTEASSPQQARSATEGHEGPIRLVAPARQRAARVQRTPDQGGS